MNELNKIAKYSSFHDFVFEILNDKTKEVALKEIRKMLRLINNNNSEPGMLRTALVSLKAFKHEETIKTELEEIASRLRRITATKTI